MAKGREKQLIGEEQQFRTSGVAPIESGYEEFAKTGGISPKTQQEIQQRESSALSSMYGDLQNRLSRQKAIQGGYSPGYGAQLAQLGRQSGEQIAEGTRDTDIALQQLIQSGRLAGLGGMSDVAGLRLASMGQQVPLATRPGLFQNILGAIGTVTGGGG